VLAGGVAACGDWENINSAITNHISVDRRRLVDKALCMVLLTGMMSVAASSGASVGAATSLTTGGCGSSSGSTTGVLLPGVALHGALSDAGVLGVGCAGTCGSATGSPNREELPELALSAALLGGGALVGGSSGTSGSG
jgi:hypothetical protein